MARVGLTDQALLEPGAGQQPGNANNQNTRQNPPGRNNPGTSGQGGNQPSANQPAQNNNKRSPGTSGQGGNQPSANPGGGPGPNRLPMTVTTQMYIGERWEVVFRHDALAVQAYTSAPLRHESYHVEFPPDAVWVF